MGAQQAGGMNGQGAAGPDFRMLLLRFTSSDQWERALETAREWLASEPENQHAHMGAGHALVALQRFTEAEPHLAQVLAKAPANALAHRFMSIVHFHFKRFAAADDAIHKAISLAPHDAFHWYHLAWMNYQRGDAASAFKYAEKARELAPREADIINLLALCTPHDAEHAARLLQYYHEALELEPENPQVHNNLGVYYMNMDKNYAEAEECFRRALFFDPASKLSRSNLFSAIKHRDVVYRILCAPKDACLKIFALVSESRKQNILLYILMLPLWLVAFRFVLGGLLLWFLLVWPTVKFYEYLTLGDLRARAGEIGARRGGLLGYRQWPLRVRLGIFVCTLLAFWGSAALFCAEAFSDTPVPGQRHLQATLGTALMVGMMTMLGLWARQKSRQGLNWWQARKQNRRMDSLLESEEKRER